MHQSRQESSVSLNAQVSCNNMLQVLTVWDLRKSQNHRAAKSWDTKLLIKSLDPSFKTWLKVGQLLSSPGSFLQSRIRSFC